MKEVDGAENVRVGGRVTETREFMGRRVRSTLEVTALEPGRELSLRVVDGPVPLTVRHLLEPAGEGTRVTLEAEADVGLRFRLAAEVAVRAASRQIRHDLERLKGLLEVP